MSLSRSFRVKIALRLASVALLTLMTACGGGSETSSNQASINGLVATDSDTRNQALVSTKADDIATLVAVPSVENAEEPLSEGAPVALLHTEASACLNPASPAPLTTPSSWGKTLRPFAANSPWNSRPVVFTLGTGSIPASSYYPSVTAGPYSVGVFEATAQDTQVTVHGPTSVGVWDADSEIYRPQITLPRWPALVVPASGGDGHAEVVDTVTGIVHSFWKLKQVGGAWVATQYAWTKLAGRGMGDPAHYLQGARSAGLSAMGGLIRKHEVNDGDTKYRHALAMSLTYNALSAKPTYQYPATSSDTNAATTNSGSIAMGALMMLPSNFDTRSLATPELRKIAETLKSFGAYVVDRNTGTPFVIYVEIGSDFDLHKGGWSNSAAKDLETLRLALRPLNWVYGWADGNGEVYASSKVGMNLLSMRGNWFRTSGTQSGVYDTWRQAVVFPPTTTPIEQQNAGGRAYVAVSWAKPKVGATYRLTALTNGGGRFRMTITDKATGAVAYDSGDMSNAQSADFHWPSENVLITTYAKSGVGGVESTVRAELTPAVVPANINCV